MSAAWLPILLIPLFLIEHQGKPHLSLFCPLTLVKVRMAQDPLWSKDGGFHCGFSYHGSELLVIISLGEATSLQSVGPD